MRSADVVVVGAGPAGAAAAVTLARAGREVVVVDKARFPRDKICGDGLTAGALRLLEDLGLDPGAVPSWQRVDDVVVRGPSGHEVTFPLPRGQGTYAAVARRADLDAALVELARTPGSRCSTGTPAPGSPRRRRGGRRRSRASASVEAGFRRGGRRHVVAGAQAPRPGHPGLPGRVARLPPVLHRRRAPGPPRELFVWFEPDLLPGYAWSFPLPGNRANVGFGIQRGGKVARVQDMAAIWPDLLARPHVRAVLGEAARPESPHRAWPIPARIDEAVLAGGPHAVRGRRRHGHRPAHRRGHRPGAPHRRAGGRGGGRPRARRRRP